MVYSMSAQIALGEWFSSDEPRSIMVREGKGGPARGGLGTVLILYHLH